MQHDARPFIYIVVAWSDVLRRDTVKVFPALLANDITPKVSVLTQKSVTFFFSISLLNSHSKSPSAGRSFFKS